LLVSQINYTLTNFADRTEKFSPDEVPLLLQTPDLARHSKKATAFFAKESE